jgi:hypothetical protein
MAQSGYTPILTYASGTATNVPLAANMTSSASGAELALNYADGKLFYKDSGGVVQVLASKAGNINVSSFSAGTTGFTPNTATTGAVTLAGTLATTNGGTGLTSFTANGVLYASSSSALTTGSALTFDGTNFALTQAGNPTLTVKTTGAGNNPLYRLQADTNYWEMLGVFSDANDTLRFRYNGTDAYIIDNTGISAWSVGGSEQMRLTSTGLGIGTSTLQGKLTVQGDIYTRGGGVYYVQNNDNTNNYYLQNSGATGAANGSLNFVQGGVAVRATLDSSGNLGLGVTPSAWGGNWKSISLGNWSALANSNANSYTMLGNNTYASADNTWNYRNTASSAMYMQVGGAHQWYNAPSGTAGNAITFTQAMTLDASGNLLVGTTSASITNGGIWMPPGGGSSSVQIGHASGTASGNVYINFGYSSNTIGSVTQSGTTAVLYNLTSDQRLKNDLGAVTSTDVISNTVIHDFTWKSDGSKARGVFAQEAAKVIPSAVKVGDDGEEVTDTWQVDYSKYVPDIIVELQSLRKRLAILEAK